MVVAAAPAKLGAITFHFSPVYSINNGYVIIHIISRLKQQLFSKVGDNNKITGAVISAPVDCLGVGSNLNVKVNPFASPYNCYILYIARRVVGRILGNGVPIGKPAVDNYAGICGVRVFAKGYRLAAVIRNIKPFRIYCNSIFGVSSAIVFRGIYNFHQ